KDFTDFKWEKVYIFPPYTSTANVNKALGFDWPSAKNTGIEMHDSFNLLVFTNGGKVVSYVNFPRSSGDFVLDRPTNGLGPNEARFVIQKKDGRLILQL